MHMEGGCDGAHRTPHTVPRTTAAINARSCQVIIVTRYHGADMQSIGPDDFALSAQDSIDLLVHGLGVFPPTGTIWTTNVSRAIPILC